MSQKQAFIMASVSALLIALAVAVASIPADGVSWARFLGPSRRLDPFINFGSAFLMVPPIFLGYYHLGRVGVLLGMAVSAVLCFASQVSAFFIFVSQVAGQSLALQETAYVSVCVLLGGLILLGHAKMANSAAVQEAQRSLRLTKC